MTAQLKRTSMIYGIGAVIYICGVILTQQMTVTDWVKFFLFFTAYLFIGFDTFRKQSDKLMQKRVFTE